MSKIIMILVSTSIFACSCVSNSSSPLAAKKSLLSAYERHLCDSLGIDSSIILDIRTQTDSSIRPFPANLDDLPSKDSSVDGAKEKLHGFLFNTDHTATEDIINSLYNDLHHKGYTIFTYDKYFGFSRNPDLVGVLSSVNKYEILRRVGTDGINFNIDNDSLLHVIKKFDEKYSLQLISAGVDWCEFSIHNPHVDWAQLANEAYKVCPDIVEQGTGTVEKLAGEMKKTGRLYFWWD